MAKIMTMMSKQLLGYCICLRVNFPRPTASVLGIARVWNGIKIQSE